jgi:S-adenosylmethionine:tRNA ribosyltransferase-isomerase
MFHLSDYDYDLPEDRIAQTPCGQRAGSRLMRINRQTQGVSHHRFFDLEEFLTPGDLLVVNNTRVIPARLTGTKKTGGRVEVLIIDYAGGMRHLQENGIFQCDCLIRASRRPKPGTELMLGRGIRARVVAHEGRVSCVAFPDGETFADELRENGQIPLPPYIRRTGDPGREKQDRKDYQTVYARDEGAVAAPTAGLHFTEDLLGRLADKGVDRAEITLHVGYGTFVPVRVDDIRDHEIHSEYFTVSEEAAEKITRTKRQGGRIVAVGTTSVRTLEFLAEDNGSVRPGTGQCNLYIYPGYRFKCVDAMVTNFHLPKSTLLMLISAFYDRERILAAYKTAVDEGYRFFSYGDAMLID